jgi:hypothetical protein
MNVAVAVNFTTDIASAMSSGPFVLGFSMLRSVVSFVFSARHWSAE